MGADVIRKLLVAAAVAFAAWYLLTEPASAAQVVRGAIALLQHGAHSLAAFLNKL